MLFHSVFQGVRVGPVPYARLCCKRENTLISGESRCEVCALPSWERQRIRSLLLIFHVNYCPGSHTPLQRRTARTQTEINENFSGKSPPGDAGEPPLDFVGS